MVIDGSRSMQTKEQGENENRWTSVQRQLRQDIERLAASGVPAELTVVKFGKEPSKVGAAPAGSGWSGTLLDPADAAQVYDDVMHRIGPADGWGTALFESMQDAMGALRRDLGSGRYSGGQVVVYSDGADSSKESSMSGYQSRRGAVLEAVRQLRADFPLSNVCIRPFGEEARQVAKELPDVKDLGAAALPAPPKVVGLGLSPEVTAIAPLRAARRQVVSVRAPNLDAELAAGVTVTVFDGDRTVNATRQGVAAWVAELELPKSERGVDLEVVAQAGAVRSARAVLRAPALALPSNPRDWGLPRCGSDWGVVCSVGDPIPLSVRVPADVQVTWSEAGGRWAGDGASVTHPGFASAGTRELVVQVRTADGSRDQKLRVTVIDPVLVIDGPASADVGSDVAFKVREIPAGARAGDVQWFVDGRKAGSGAELRQRFQQRGRAAVSAEVEVSACDSRLRASGSAVVAVNPVPSVEPADAELVRGAVDSNVIPVRVLVASRVAALEVSFGRSKPMRVSVAEAVAGDQAVVRVKVPAEFCARDGSDLEVRVVPEIRGDDGKPDSAASARAAQSRTYTVRAPSPTVSILKPEAGHEASYSVQMQILLEVRGSAGDLAAVKSVRMQVTGSPDQELALGKDLTATAAFTPKFESASGSRLTISAQALDASGAPIGKPDSRMVELRQPKIQLRASVDQVHIASLEPADLSVEVVSPEGAPGWEAGISSSDWSIEPRDSVEVVSETKTKAVLRVKGAREVVASVHVRRADGGEDLGPVRVPVLLGKVVPDFRVTEVGSNSQVGMVIGKAMLRIHDRTTGPVAKRAFSMRRGEGEWESVNPESFSFAEAARRDERVEVRATYVSIDGSEVDGGIQMFSASPGHNWAWVVVVGLVGLGLSVVAWWLCDHNELIGAEVSWSADDLGNESQQTFTIRWLRGMARSSIITKRARVPLPEMYGHGQYDWLRRLVEDRCMLEIGGIGSSLARPRLTAGGQGVGIPPDSTEGRVRRTRLQPTADGAEPVYLAIQPSPTASFIKWTSLAAALTAIWATFAFLYFRGYI
jgi:hypothetical protein